MLSRESITRSRLRHWWPYLLLVAVWGGANCIALACIDVYESRCLEAEFHVPASVIRQFEWRQCPVERQTSGERKSSTTPFLLWYRYRPPLRWSRSGTVPLVVFLHGAGERGNDNVRQLRSLPATLCEAPMRDEFPCAVLAPQCPTEMNWSTELEAQTSFLDGLSRMIDTVLVDRQIDRNRIYLIGSSMGGFGCWRLAARFPDRFAAVVPICGGGNEEEADRLVGVPLWAVHGELDDVVPVTQSRTMIAAIEAAGGEPRYLELPGAGHGISGEVIRADSEVFRWMFQQSLENRPARKN